MIDTSAAICAPSSPAPSAVSMPCTAWMNARRLALVAVDSATAAPYVHGLDISDATVGFTAPTIDWYAVCAARTIPAEMPSSEAPSSITLMIFSKAWSESVILVTADSAAPPDHAFSSCCCACSN
ncbi:MAG TPA: hypothetical protein VE442_00630 [Jatrophihabitans sp.]|nr:hypothetical protein [Jatrophihabitans sp.]